MVLFYAFYAKQMQPRFTGLFSLTFFDDLEKFSSSRNGPGFTHLTYYASYVLRILRILKREVLIGEKNL
jgi:hypothetical protein